MAADQGEFDRLRVKLRGKEAAVKKARVQCNGAEKALDAARSAGEGVEAAEARLSSAQAGLKKAEGVAAAAETALKEEQERLERAGVKVVVETRPKPSPVARGPTPSKSPVARPRPGPPPAALTRKPSAASPAAARPPKAPKPASKPKPRTPQAVVEALAAGLPPPAPTTVSTPIEPMAPVVAPVTRRFPMEDSEIDEFDPDRLALHTPDWLGSEDDSARLAAALYVCEAAGYFAGAFKLEQPPRLADLQRALAADASPADAAMQGTLYHRLLAFHLENPRDKKTATDRDVRLLSVLTEVTWPEVLRQWLTDRSAAAATATAAAVTEAAAAEGAIKGDKSDATPVSLPPADHLEAALAGLAAAGADGVGPDTHLALLHWMLDEAVDNARMRTAMQEIEDASAEAQRRIKAAMAEERRKIQELKDASKEAKKQRTVGFSVQAPSLFLPEELHVYRGDPEDATAKADFDTRRKKGLEKLERERAQWEVVREKERAALLERSREEYKAEQARQADIQAANDVIKRTQEELEARQEEQAPRCAPLGSDRHYRSYWMFSRADPAALYVEDEGTGLWGVFSKPEDVRKLAESLDRRGEREAALAKALEKRRLALVKAMLDKENGKKLVGGEAAAAAAAKRPASMLTGSGEEGSAWEGSDDEDDESDDEIDAREKQRRAKEKERKALEETRKAAVPCFKLDTAAAAAAAASLLGSCEALAFAGTLARLLEVRELASAAGVQGIGSDSNWAAWTAGARAVARGQVRLPSGNGFVPAPSAAALCAALQARAIELETAVVAATQEIAGTRRSTCGTVVVVKASGSDGEGGSQSEGEEEMAAPSTALFDFEVFRGAETASEALKGISIESFFPLNATSKALLRHRRDRLAWQVAAVQQDASVAQVAFWVEVLARQVTMLLGGEVKSVQAAVKPQAPKQPARGGHHRKRTDRRRKSEEEVEEEEDTKDMDVDIVDLTGEGEEQKEEGQKPRQDCGRKRGQGGRAPGPAAKRSMRARKK